MSRQNRPTAFSQSFGDDPDTREVSLQCDGGNEQNSLYGGTRHNPPISASHSLRLPAASSSQLPSTSDPRSVSHTSKGKRKETVQQGGPTSRPEKRSRIQLGYQRLDSAKLDDCLIEAASLPIGDEEANGWAGEEKPIRYLTEYIIFDASHQNTMVSLDCLLEPHDHYFKAYGKVGQAYLNEEDAGQDAALDETDDQDRELQSFCTTAITTFSIDYADSAGYVYLQTGFATYILGKPARAYSHIFQDFYWVHRMAQLIISAAVQDPLQCTKAYLVSSFQGLYDDTLDEVITEDMIHGAYATVAAVIEAGNYVVARQSPFIQHIVATQKNQPKQYLPTSHKARVSKNIDIHVLQPENQSQTVVMPLIASLSTGLFRESLHVLASQKPSSPSFEAHETAYKMLVKWLCAYLDNQGARIDHALYSIGDTIAVPAVSYPGRDNHPFPTAKEDILKIPQHHTLADYFWFGRIVSISRSNQTAHVQWFEHSSKTLLQEIHDPNELFLTQTCGSVELSTILSKCKCYNVKTRGRDAKLPKIRNCWKSLEFYYSFIYDQPQGSFTEANEDTSMLLPDDPSDNCIVCAKRAAADTAAAPQIVEQGSSIAVGGHSYHLNDFALVESEGGPCLIGQLIEFAASPKARDTGACSVSLKLFGRVRDMLVKCSAQQTFSDEQELFMTDEVLTTSATKLLKPCKVKASNALTQEALSEYTKSSPTHFYCTYHCLKADIFHWQQRKTLVDAQKILTTCAVCFVADQNEAKQRKMFATSRPLRAFDPFSGVGAFALSMEETKALQLTHAAEISPSAAETLRKNSNAVVYNQCANRLLEYAVKAASGQHQTLLSIEEKMLPPILKPGDIDCVVTGFPCQPHSTLNMYQRANDRKSHLILTLLSWIDFLRPKHCFFENVRGFIHYNLNSIQQNRYSTRGGIPAGGLKFLVRALLVMGYQVHFALLEAAHYGTPQGRVRFFLIASQLGCTLPTFPAPLYYFPSNSTLAIKLPHGLTINPIPPIAGVVPFQYISVNDAISDLPWFDWHNPLNAGERPRRLENGEIVALKTCNRQKSTCGISQPVYRFQEPRTRFQKKAREYEHLVKDLQHFTQPLKEETVARVTYIPLIPGADFHDLFKPQVPRSLVMKDWQISNPSSAVARRAFKDGFYGRLDEKKWFHTTVTNVDPMAKQSWVLNPYCKRILTVRELARSQGFPDHFQFYSVTDDVVKTMHREIGNAVPWPVGVALGHELWKAEFKDWTEKRTNPIVVD